jgi:hypothetical protein
MQMNLERLIITLNILENMYRLVINSNLQSISELSERLVNSFGSLNLVVYNDQFFIAQTIKLDDKEELFHRANMFTIENEHLVTKVLFTDQNNTIENQVNTLHSIALPGFYSEVETHQFTVGEKVKVDDKLWTIVHTL